MPRKKIDNKNKKVNFGITIHPEINKLLNEYLIDKNISKSKLIEDIMIDFLKNNKNIND